MGKMRLRGGQEADWAFLTLYKKDHTPYLFIRFDTVRIGLVENARSSDRSSIGGLLNFDFYFEAMSYDDAVYTD